MVFVSPSIRNVSSLLLMSFPHTNASVLSQYGSIFRFVPPPDWQSLSDRQLSFFFKQLAGDLPIEEILTLSLFKWADLRVLCKTHDGKFLIKQKKLLKQEAQLSILQIQNLTKTLSFLRYFSAHPSVSRLSSVQLPLPTTSWKSRFRRSSLPTTIIRAFSTPRTRLCLTTSPRFCTQWSSRAT